MSHPRLWLSSAVLALACSTPSEPTPEPGPDVKPQPVEVVPASCPSAAIPETRAPDVTARMEHAEFWLDGGHEDEVLLGPAERELIAMRIAATPGSWRDPSDPAFAEPAHVDAELGERLEWLRGRVATGKYVEGEAGALERAATIIGEAEPIGEADALHLVVAETPLWCVPTLAGLYTPPIDREFDRNQCASLHVGEMVRLIRSSAGWGYVDAGHSVGWIELGVPGSTPLGRAIKPANARLRRLAPTRWWVLDDWPVPEHPGVVLRAGTCLRENLGALQLPTRDGEVSLIVPADAPISATPLSFTRRALFEQSFAQLGDPYGWGGRGGRRDCSSLVFDVFAQFDVLLGRNSAVQSQLGVHTVELAGQSDEAKRAAIRSAAERGVVLLYMPGHIMLYLGHHSIEGVDHDYGLSAISDYLVPCTGGPDTVHRLDRVAVTTLELGRGSERRAYLERIERLAIFGPAAN